MSTLPRLRKFPHPHTTGLGAILAAAACLAAWSEPTFAAGLSEARPPQERMRILDSFFTRYRDAVATAPEGHGMDYIHVHLVCRKASR